MKDTAEASSRLYYLDWLRVLAMFGVFFYHNARFFDGLIDWHVKNATTNFGATAFVAFVTQWGMPLFFLLAGAGAYYALRAIRASEYALDRTFRLVIPLIFGMLVIVVPQAYFEAAYHGTLPTGNLIGIYTQYLKTLPELNWYHLWFLEQLFIFSIITIPIFIAIGKTKRSIISGLSTQFDRPWVLLPVIILSAVALNAFLYPAGFWGAHDWSGWNIVNNLLFFIFGYLIFANERIMGTIRRLGWVTLATGIIATACLLFFIDELQNPTDYFGTGNYLLAQFIQAVNTWCWVLTILSFVSRFLTRNNKFLKYANEAVLPFYILHQTVIIVIGFYVVKWNSGVLVKYLTISTTSFITIMILYELLVRRFSLFRFLFGMRLKRRISKTPVK